LPAEGGGGSPLCGWMKNEKVEKRGREGFMPRLTLLLTVAYYGNFLKLWVGERREQCKQKTDNYWTANRRRERLRRVRRLRMLGKSQQSIIESQIFRREITNKAGVAFDVATINKSVRLSFQIYRAKLFRRVITELALPLASTLSVLLSFV